MSWAWPRSRPSTGDLLDMDDFNDNLLAFSVETDGYLNEHNFSVDTLADLWEAGQVEDDIAHVFWHTESTDTRSLPYSTDWREVPNTQIEFDSPGGMVLVIFSAQFYQRPDLDPTVGGLQFCLELDGAAQMNSLAGSGDMGNETVAISGTASDPELDYNAGPGFRGRFGMTVKGTYKVQPGQHSVRMLVRAIHSGGDASPTVFAREGLVLHMWCL